MSDVEEPPIKVTKYEMSQTFTQVEEMEEGQEEWLSEGLLTDDDYNPENADNSATDPDRTRSDLDSQGVPEETIEESMQEATGQEDSLLAQESAKEEEAKQESFTEVLEEGIFEEVMQNGIGTTETEGQIEESNQQAQEAQNRVEDANIEQTLTNMNRQPDEAQGEAKPEAESDGNDTDDLLRMLEDDDKSKKKTKIVKPSHPKVSQKKETAMSTDEEDDDDYIFDGSTMKQLKVAKGALLARKYPATKAEPESSDEESSLEEAATMRKMFASRTFVPKQVVRLGNNDKITLKQSKDKRPVTSTPAGRQSGRGRPALKPANSIVNVVDRPKDKKQQKKQQQEHDEIINEEEFLEEDDFDLREDFADESDSELDKRAIKQRVMRPPRMDEDVPEDGDSHDDDNSLYDELPSSDSEDLEEWFTLDIRSERAGEYLPLLGNKAYDLLLQERQRVANRISSLRDNLSALNTNGKQQAERLRRATAALADVDDMLKAA